MAYQDYLLRQIEDMAQMVAKILFWKTEEEIPLFDAQGDVLASGLLHRRLTALLSDGRVNDAENELFAAAQETPTAETLRVGLVFYQTLEGWSPARLQAADFTREEIAEGLAQLAALCAEISEPHVNESS